MADDRCPTGETLAAFSLGLLADEEVDAIAAHLDSCGRCEAAILGLEGAPGRPLQAPRGGGGPGMGLFDELLGKYEPGRRVGGPPPMRWPDAEETAWGPSGGLRAAGRSTGAERPADAPGGLRLGDFRLLREVGRGGMGVVFEAIQESLGRRVALKVLRGSIKADPLALQRFRREAQAAARLHHTNIVAVFGVGEEGGSPYYVMQFIDGPGLDRVVQEMRRGRAATGPGPSTETVASGPGPGTPGSRRGRTGGVARSTPTGTLPPLEATAVAGEGAEAPRGGPAPRPGPPASLPGWMSSAGARGRDTWRAIAEIGAQVADALHHAHEHRTLHRDIKPSNILLDDEGTPWLADFGLAKAAEQDDVTQTGDIVGTIRYMAPERFRGQCDHRSDIYSLGLTLYELIALRPAFDQAERNDLIFQVTEGEAPRLRGLAPEVPRDLELIVHKAIERAPAHRYRAAGEVADDLRRFLDGRPIRARRVGPAEQFARWCRRNPWVSGLTAAVFALLLAIAWGASWAAIEIAAKAANLEVARRELDRSLYMARMNSAPLAGETANMPQLRELLDPYLRPTSAGDLRGFEWYYWWRFALPASRGLGRNERPIGRLAFSHDGGMVASGTEDGSIGLWPTSGAGRPIVFKAHPSVILGLAFSPDGPDLATGDDRSIRLWDGRTGLLKKPSPSRSTPPSPPWASGTADPSSPSTGTTRRNDGIRGRGNPAG